MIRWGLSKISPKLDRNQSHRTIGTNSPEKRCLVTHIIPESFYDLLDEPVYVTLVTLMPDNQPQASVVWCSRDGNDVLVNSAAGRQKNKNMEARPVATIMIIDPKTPFRYLEIRGKVTEVKEDSDYSHINSLAKLYRGVDEYFGNSAPAEMKGIEKRVIYRITPTRARAYPLN